MIYIGQIQDVAATRLHQCNIPMSLYLMSKTFITSTWSHVILLGYRVRVLMWFQPWFCSVSSLCDCCIVACDCHCWWEEGFFGGLGSYFVFPWSKFFFFNIVLSVIIDFISPCFDMEENYFLWSIQWLCPLRSLPFATWCAVSLHSSCICSYRTYDSQRWRILFGLQHGRFC